MTESNQIPREVIQTAKRLPAVRQAVKQAGLPLTARDIRPNPPIPSAQNAAPLYRQAYRVYDAQKWGKLSGEWADHLTPNRTDASRKAAREALNRSGDLLRLPEQIAARPRCDFNRPWEKGAADVLMPELMVMRQLTRLLALQAVLHMEDNNPLAAAATLRKAAMVARHASEEPVVIGVMVWAALHRIVQEAFAELLQRYGNYAEVVQAAETIQARLNVLPELRRVFGGEALFALPSLEHHRQGKRDVTADLLWEEEQLPKRDYFRPEERRIYADAWEVRYLELFQQAFRVMEAPNNTLRQVWQGLKTLAAAEEARLLSRPPQLSYYFSANLVWLYASSLVVVLQIQALMRVGEGAMAALREQNTTGKLPKTLTQPPIDPFTDKPLVYRRTDAGFLLYSLSVNGMDDGGDSRIRETGNYRLPGDIVFRYPQ